MSRHGVYYTAPAPDRWDTGCMIGDRPIYRCSAENCRYDGPLGEGGLYHLHSGLPKTGANGRNYAIDSSFDHSGRSARFPADWATVYKGSAHTLACYVATEPFEMI